MKNKIINAYIYSYASLLVIIASYKIIDLILRKNYMDAFADLFINYQGGFIRRGLIYGHENEMYKEPMNLKRGKGVYMRELRECGGRTEDKTKCAKG
ncbi:hypothetical protein [Segatella sp.]|uniref:hypothetical protein n=1 Tax=Segatella sp. TaxID=2974253 RepID=UPI003AAE7F5D